MKKYKEIKHTEEQSLLTARIAEALVWRDHITKQTFLDKETAIAKHYRHYLSYIGSVSQKDLYFICDQVNKVFEAMGSKARINDSMGEIIPSRVKDIKIKPSTLN